MVSLKNLLSNGTFPNFANIISGVTDFIRGNPLVSTASVGLGAGALGAGVTKLVSSSGTKSKKRKSTTTKRKRKSSTRKKSTRKRSKKRRIRRTPHTAGKGKDRSTRRIRMTKNGQPYVILKSGKARFIKKSSARRSRKLKGGRY